jgi:hypothetical protein
MADAPNRIVFDKQRKTMVDEHLESCYKNILEWNIEGEEGEAVEKLLDPYAVAIYGKGAILFDQSLKDIDKAFLWSSQFGNVEVFDAKPTGAKQPKFGARITGVLSTVYGVTLHQVIILAGIEYLRQIAAKVLSQTSTRN